MNLSKTWMATAVSLALFGGASLAQADIVIGNDLNSTEGANAAINQLYSANRGSNGGGDQSLQFGDQIYGTEENDILIGGLGIDVLFGYDGDDIIIGGTEDFNSFNRDRAFGGKGNDIFVWTPGDGNDFFDGGEGQDILVIGLIGESQDNDGNTDLAPFFNVSPPGTPGSQDFDGIFINPSVGLPELRIEQTPGFCRILDKSTEGMSELNLDHLVQFILRGPANNFDEAIAADPNIDPDTLDTGLRISVHLKNTEFVVCPSRSGDEIEVYDISQTPPVRVTLDDLPPTAATSSARLAR
ncbi:calcium-binding protein [Hahella sp. KA22]|uniref:calcium-binding protein n=1 Tax=Hahella sp. KA22 TaxID=1628392 RepID=UPI000FDF3600|nr:calcium-binding protein [Hahella sp. KA22]AZZ92629.1 calcium-binding protein [Hahella sp. KA22]QAY56002.1 calcium-binding protein [Hahella sp. KA22]